MGAATQKYLEAPGSVGYNSAAPVPTGTFYQHIWGKPMTPAGVLFNFYLFSFLFAINHGTITAFISIGSAVTGQTDAGYFTGTLYVTYVLVAMTFSSMLVTKLRPWKSLCAAMFIYLFYILAYVVYEEATTLDHDTRRVIAVVFSAIAGLSAGFLWTAQGAFFTQSAQLYGKMTGKEVKTITRQMAGGFSAMYVGFEFISKLCTSPIENSGTSFGTLAVIYAIIGCVAAVLTVLLIRDVPQDANRERIIMTRQAMIRKTAAAFELLNKRRKILLIIPLQLAFGFSATFFNNTLATATKTVVGENNVGYMASATPGTAMILSVIIGFISPKTGNYVLLIIGTLCYTIIPLVLIILTEEQLEATGYKIVMFYAVQGVSRVVFETANKALLSETFPKDTEAAFSNFIIWSGLASGTGYFLFGHISKSSQAIITLAFACLSVIAMVALYGVERFGRKGPLAALTRFLEKGDEEERAEDEKRLINEQEAS